MMKLNSIVLFIFVLILSWIALIILPWWSTALAGFIATAFVFKRSIQRKILWVALGGGLAWMIMTMKQDFGNQQILSQKIAALLSLPSSYWLWLIAFLIGSVTAALGAWLGASLKR